MIIITQINTINTQEIIMEGYNGGTNIDPTSLLLARGFNGPYGGGMGAGFGGAYGGVGVNGDFANASANAIRLDRNEQNVENQADFTRELMEKGQEANLHAFDAGTTAEGFSRICDKLSDSEFRTGDRQRDIEREINTNARDAAKCCCEVQASIAAAAAESAKCCCETNLRMSEGFGAVALKAAENQAQTLLKMCEDKNALSVQMAEGFSNIKDRELNAANARITQLETVNALSGHHRPS
jgi:hypothetical protein